MAAALNQVINHLHLPIAEEISRQTLAAGGIDLSKEVFDRAVMTKALVEYSTRLDLTALSIPPGLSTRQIEKVVKLKCSSPELFDDFCLRLGQKLFESGICVVKGMHSDTAQVIRRVSAALEHIKTSARDSKPEKLLNLLRAVDRSMMTFVDQANRSNEGVAFSPDRGQLRLNQIDYWALNEQHTLVAKAIKVLERRLLKDSAVDLKKWIDSHPLISINELKDLSKKKANALKNLISLGLVHESASLEGALVCAYPHGQVTEKQFEQCFSPAQREQIGRSIHEELKKRYSGKLRPLGIAEIRDEGVATLLDKHRVHCLSTRNALKPGHIVLALKYYASLGLLVKQDDGYVLSPMGQKAGLGVAVVEAVKRASSGSSPHGFSDVVDAFLRAAQRSQADQQCAAYDVQNETPGMPPTTMIDELRIPENSVDASLLRAAITHTNSGAPDQLVIVGGLLSGPPEIDRRKVRTWAVKGTMEKQIQLGAELLNSTGGRTLNVTSRVDNLAAERRAWEQALRERHITSPNDKRPAEAIIRNKVEKLNDQKQYTEQQRLAVEIAEWTEFINLVVQPLEIKLGRPLHESQTVECETGVSMNELEIIRAISRRIVSAGSLDTARAEIRGEYGSYLAFVEKQSPQILELLERVIYNAKEDISSKEVVSRGGFSLTMHAAGKSDPDYKVTVVPDFNYGKDPRTNPTAGYEGLLRAKRNLGHKIDHMHLLMGTSELIGELSSHGSWIVTGGTMQGSPNMRQLHLHHRVHQSRRKRDETVRGLPQQSSFITVSGGVHEGRITQAIKYRIATPKLLAALESNQRRNLPRKQASIYVTSDWQIGSPTMQPAMILAGLIEAIDRGVDEILINGDIRQGMNYLRYTQEGQLVEHPLNGLDSQAQYIYELLDPVLAYIRARSDADRDFKIPIFRILPGNHESNSQANKGLQGTWFVQDIAEKIRSYLWGWTNDLDFAKSHVVCPEKFVSHDGTQVDYPMLYVNRTSDLGICIQMTHYNAGGSKGSSFAPTVGGVAKAVHSLGVVEPHIRIESHMHVTGFQVRNGIVCVRTGANATGSAFEEHLLYANSPESNLFIDLDSHELPTFFVATRAYQETRYSHLLERLHRHGIMREYVSFEQFCSEKRREVSLKSRNNPTDLSHEVFDHE